MMFLKIYFPCSSSMMSLVSCIFSFCCKISRSITLLFMVYKFCLLLFNRNLRWKRSRLICMSRMILLTTQVDWELEEIIMFLRWLWMKKHHYLLPQGFPIWGKAIIAATPHDDQCGSRNFSLVDVISRSDYWSKSLSSQTSKRQVWSISSFFLIILGTKHSHTLQIISLSND